MDGRIAEYSTRPARARPCASPSHQHGRSARGGRRRHAQPPSLNASLWVDDLPLIVLRPLLGETPSTDILGRIAIKGASASVLTEKTPQTPAAPCLSTSLAVTGAEASVSALSFGRGNSLSAADRKAERRRFARRPDTGVTSMAAF